MIVIVSVAMFTGCGWATEDKTAVDSDSSPFVSISAEVVYGQKVDEDMRIFVYDKYTKIVHYLFSNYTYDPIIEGDHTYTYFSQYVNENGKYCAYDPETKTVYELD